jgi:hypothetical protein
MLQVETLTLAEWTSVLKLSTMWQIDNLCVFAVKTMSNLSASEEEWITLLKVSSKHPFVDVRELTIQTLTALHTMSPLKKILVAKECMVPDWFLDGVVGFLTRKQTISVEEEDQLGFKTMTKLFRLREMSAQCKSCQSKCRHVLRISYPEDIRTAFQMELEEVGYRRAPTPTILPTYLDADLDSDSD